MESTSSSSIPEAAENFTVEKMNEMREKEEIKMAESRKKGKEPKLPIFKPPGDKVFLARQKHEERSLQEHEEVVKKDVLMKLNLYCERFPGLNQELPKLSPKCSLAECVEVLNLARDLMASRGSVRAVAQYMNMGFKFLESFWGDGREMAKIHPLLGLNLKGMSQMFRDGKFPDLDPIILEIDIEYPWIGRRPLGFRLMGTMFESMIKVHIENNTVKTEKLESQPPVETHEEEEAL